jgi:hypothetical protein
MECNGWMVVQGFEWWVGKFLALWRVDGWVIIWSFLVRYLVTFWCFVYFMITSCILLHKGLSLKFIMLQLIVKTFIYGNGIVADIGLHEWLSSNW